MPFDSIFRPGLFAGQTHIVTGGGSGIGRCTGHELAHLGATVVLVGRRADPESDRHAVGGIRTAKFRFRPEPARGR